MIEFVNIKTGERTKLTRPHQIGAYINSSDLSVNSNKGQDFGWRLAPEVVIHIDEMREDSLLMQSIGVRVGLDPSELTTIHLVQHISYLDDLKARVETAQAERQPAYKDAYEAEIEASRRKESTTIKAKDVTETKPETTTTVSPKTTAPEKK